MSDLQTWVKPNGTKVEINEDSVDADKELGWEPASSEPASNENDQSQEE